MAEDKNEIRIKQITAKYERDKSQIEARYKAQSDAMAVRKKGGTREIRKRYKMSAEGIERSREIKAVNKGSN